jgi:hypothetical protein
MKEQDQIDQEYRVEAAEIARPGIEPLIPILPWPPRVRVSGLYAASRIVTPPSRRPAPCRFSPFHSLSRCRASRRQQPVRGKLRNCSPGAFFAKSCASMWTGAIRR